MTAKVFRIIGRFRGVYIPGFFGGRFRGPRWRKGRGYVQLRLGRAAIVLSWRNWHFNPRNPVGITR